MEHNEQKVAKLPTKIVNISDIVLDTYNPREPITLEYKEYIRKNINDKDIGFIEPLVININEERKNILISGHVRIGILVEEGFTQVECSTVNLDISREMELNVALNKVRATFDKMKLLNLGETVLVNAGFKPQELIELNKSAFSDVDGKLKDKAKDLQENYEVITFKVPKDQVVNIKEICAKYSYDLVAIITRCESSVI